MKIALTTSVAAIPPTYFLVSHAQQLATSHEFELFALLADVGDPAVTIPVHDFAPFRSLKASARQYLAPFAGAALSDAVKIFDPDVIHQHFATWSGPAISAAKSCGVPLLTTLHGYDVRVMGRRPVSPMDLWHRRNVKAAQQYSTRVLSVSTYLANQAIACGFDAKRLEVHYQGIDTDYFTPAGGDERKTDVPVISFVGALDAHKGPMDLIRASLDLIHKYEHRLLLIGTGPLAREVREIASRHPHIELLGRVERDRVREVLQISHAMILPSRKGPGGAEAAGLVLLEAQACGTPVIAYNVGGISEMMGPGSGDLLIEEGNLGDLTAAIGGILTLRAVEHARLGSAVRKFVVAERSLARSCSELDEHYHDLVGSQ